MFEQQRRILEKVIERHEDYSFRIKAWFAAVAAGLAAALHVYNVHFTAWWEFLTFLVASPRSPIPPASGASPQRPPEPCPGQ
jgi:hypothetical protein